MRSAPVQVVCRGCSVPFRTTVRGSGTRCARCGVQRYVRRRQEWEGPRDLPAARHPALDRAPVWCGCRCGHEWESLAADRASIRCPSCRHSVRVPRREPGEGGTGPAVPPPPRRVPAPRLPARARPAPRQVRWPTLPRPTLPAPRQAAPPGPPASSPASPPVPRPAGGRVRAGVVTALYGHPLVPPAHYLPGRCVLIGRRGEPCLWPAEVPVIVGGRQWGLCTGHADSVDRQHQLGRVPPLS